MKSKLQTFISFALIFAMIGSYFVSPNIAKVEAASKKLKVTVSTKTIAVNTSVTLKTNVKAKFKSSNKKIATVSALGVVKGKKAGKATITVTSKANKSQKKTVKITVKNQLVITAPEDANASLKVGETTTIKTNLASIYESSDANIAEVSSSGMITAKSAGKATITVTSKKYKKLTKTIRVTVISPEEPATEATTQQPTSDDSVKPGNKPTTETPMKHNPTSEEPTSETPTSEKNTEEPVSEQPTSEKPTSEEPTSEDPTPVDPTPDEKTLVGIEARYRGEKVPNNLDMITIHGLDMKLVFNDGSKEKLVYGNNNFKEISFDFINQIEENGKKYAIYKLTYKIFSTEIKLELVDTEEIYPYQTEVWYTNDNPINKNELPNLDDLDSSVMLIDYKTSVKVDKSKLRFDLYFDRGDEYNYTVSYDYVFTDENSNEMYVCTWCTMYVPYK